MDFIIKLLILTNKIKNYKFILVIFNHFTKKIYYKLVKVIINTSKIVKIIFNIVI